MEDKIKKDLEQSIKNSNDIVSNMSRFYSKINKVVGKWALNFSLLKDNVADIDKKKDINQYAHEMVTKQVNKDFKGKFLNRKLERENNENVNFTNKLVEENNENSDSENIQTRKHSFYETEREKTIRIFKLNSSRILHERNKYVFLASVAERAISLGLKLSDVLGFVLIKKLFKMLCYLRYILQNRVGKIEKK